MDLLFTLGLNLFFILCNMRAADFTEQCPKTFILKNGIVKFQSRGGVTAVFTCDPGFILRGSNVSHCQTDGHWSAPFPSCEQNEYRCSSSQIETIFLTPGESVTINCSKETTTESKQFWTSNGAFIDDSLIENDTLVISPVMPGLYVCFSYSASEVNILRSVKIILSQEIPLHPQKCGISFKNKTSNIFLAFGSNVSLSCEVNSLLAEISWLKDGKYISPENNFHSKFHFNISNMEKSDEGNYTCVIRERRVPQCSLTKSMIVKMKGFAQRSSNFICGQPVISTERRLKRVIDGNRAAPLSAPWMCMLSIDREPPFCGCSLIADKWVISAAHCFRSPNKQNTSFMAREEIRQKVRVKFGKQQRRQTEKDEVVRNIRNLIIYPKYKLVSDAQNLANEHDIAVVELHEPVMFQPNILPVCLPPPGFMKNIPPGTLGIVTGWGRVSVRDSVMALTLQEASLPLVNNSSCQQSTNYAITENMLCAGYAESYRPDTCSGDSGGPFVVQKFNRWFLAGVVSWGEGCSSPKKFGIYTRVEKYVPWIQTILAGKSTES